MGENARSRVDVMGQGIREVKRKMGSSEKILLLDREYRPEEISALILRQLKENAEAALGIAIRDVVLSVPANFPDAARQATLNAGELAGLNIIRLINEPTAAALAFGIQNIELEEQLVLFDFGGGTLDITVLEMVAGVLDVKSSFGDPHLGGKDFDDRLISLILAKFQAQHPESQISEKSRQILKESAQAAKKALSNQLSYLVRLPNFCLAHQDLIDLEVEVTWDEFEAAIAPLLEQARQCIQQALNAKKIRPEAGDRVLLIGGTTYIPAVRKLVRQMFGQEPRTDVDPDLAVGLGTCISAALAQGLISEESGLILTDVAPFGLGIEIVSQIGGRYILAYEPLILPNTTIPYSVKKTYSLLHSEQEEVQIKLYQDHTGTARLGSEVIDTGLAGTIKNIPPAPDGHPYPVEIQFSYNINGVAKVTATIPAINKSTEIQYGKSALRMDSQDKADASERIRELWRQNAKARRYEGLIDQADRFMASIPPQERFPLSRAVSELKETLTIDNSEDIERMGSYLVDLMFDLENDQE